MKRLLLMMAFALAAAAGRAAQADWLYWSVADAATPDGAVCFAYAVLCDAEDWTKTYAVGETGAWKVRANADARSTPAVASDVSAAGAAGFSVLLYDAEDAIVAVGAAVPRDAIAEHIYKDMWTAGEGTPYVFTDVGAVPEPSGGVLLALGVGALALRRRRRPGKERHD